MRRLRSDLSTQARLDAGAGPGDTESREKSGVTLGRASPAGDSTEPHPQHRPPSPWGERSLQAAGDITESTPTFIPTCLFKWGRGLSRSPRRAAGSAPPRHWLSLGQSGRPARGHWLAARPGFPDAAARCAYKGPGEGGSGRSLNRGGLGYVGAVARARYVRHALCFSSPLHGTALRFAMVRNRGDRSGGGRRWLGPARFRAADGGGEGARA